MEATIKTPETDPEHHTVGRRFRGWGGGTYFCDSYDPRYGYWMTNEATQERGNVSERAIGATFHLIIEANKA